MADLKALAESMRKWEQSARLVGDGYDEKGRPEMAARLWGEAEGYAQCAEMLEREIEREARDV